MGLHQAIPYWQQLPAMGVFFIDVIREDSLQWVNMSREILRPQDSQHFASLSHQVYSWKYLIPILFFFRKGPLTKLRIPPDSEQPWQTLSFCWLHFPSVTSNIEIAVVKATETGNFSTLRIIEKRKKKTRMNASIEAEKGMQIDIRTT